MKKPLSGREKKRQISAGVEALKNKPGWNPAALKQTRNERIDAAQQADRTATTYNKAGDCAACAQERAVAKDDTALCDKHLAAAMGAK